MIKKRNEPKNLAKLLKKPGVIIDKTPQSSDYFNITFLPNELVAGKNVIKVQGTQNLVKTTEVQFEIFDSNGTPIFYEVLNYLAADGSRAIVVYIYPETATGRATLYLAGRAAINAETGAQLPASSDAASLDYVKEPNILWTSNIIVNTTKENTSEIIYLAAPKVTIKELIQTFKVPNTVAVPLKISTSGSNNFISSNPSNLMPPAGSGLVASTGYTPPTTLNVVKEGQFKISVNAPTLSTDTVLNTARTVGTSGDVIRLDDKKLLSRVYTRTPFFKKDMQGGSLVVTVDTSSLLPKGTDVITLGQFIDGAYVASNIYNTTIVEVVNDTTAVVSEPFRFYYRIPTRTSSGTNKQTIQSAIGFSNATSFTASYIQRVTEVTDTESSQSYADIYISNLEPASGDVYKVQTFYKPYGALGNFTDAGFTLIENTSIMNDTASLVSDILLGQKEQQKGDFTSQNVIDTYWELTNVNIAGAVLPAITSSGDRLIDGMTITTGSGITLKDVDANNINASATYVTVKDNLNVSANTEYKLIFKTVGVNSSTYKTTQYPNATIDVYISGSIGIDAEVDETITDKRLNARSKKFLGNKNLGTYLGSFDAAGAYLENAYQFRTLSEGTVKPLFVVRSGQWTLSDIDIIAEKQSGFTPNYTNFKVRIPSVYINTEMIFNFKYFDSANNPAPVESNVVGIIFKGNNTYIAGGNNLLTGSVYIGNTVGGGIEMSGVSSGYLRSVGYEGFTSASLGKGPGGFLIWSGSNKLDVGVDTYRDVGLELVGANDNSHLIFSTSGSGRLDIKAESFFIGSQNTQYISGSNGQIEISSSIFWLDPATNTLVIGASASILAPVSADQIFTPAIINGSQSNVTNASSSITNQGFAKFVSASIGGFEINTSEIKSTNNRIVLKSNGQFTGSDALITGDVNANTGYFKDINIIGTLYSAKAGPHVTAYTNAPTSRIIETWIAPTNTETKTILSQSFAFGSASFTASVNTRTDVVVSSSAAITYASPPGTGQYDITGSNGIEYNIFYFDKPTWVSISGSLPGGDTLSLVTSSLTYPLLSHGYVTSSINIVTGSRIVTGLAVTSGSYKSVRITGINTDGTYYYVTSSMAIDSNITSSFPSDITFRVKVTGSIETGFEGSLNGKRLDYGRLGWKLTGPIWTGSVTGSGDDNPAIEYYKDFNSFPDYRSETSFLRWNQDVNSFEEYQFSSSFDLNGNTITPFSGFIFLSSSYAIVSQSLYSEITSPTFERVINYSRPMGAGNTIFIPPVSTNQYGTPRVLFDSYAVTTSSYNNVSASLGADSIESDWIDITSLKNSDGSVDGLKLQFAMRWVDNMSDSVNITSYFGTQPYTYRTYGGHNSLGLYAYVFLYGENLDTGIPVTLAQRAIVTDDGTYSHNTYTWYVVDEFIDSFLRYTNDDVPSRIKIKVQWYAHVPDIAGAGFEGRTYAYALGRFNGIALSELRLVKAAEAKALAVTDLKIRDTSISTDTTGESIVINTRAILPTPGKTLGSDSFTTIGSNDIAFSNAYINGVFPGRDATYDLGSSTRRWSNVWAANGTIQTSDRNQKQNIRVSDLGLNFINQLTPVSYNWISRKDTSLHYGLIAQDLKEVLDKNSKDDVYMAFDGTSIAYAELIGPMIKAIQELSDKVTRLETEISSSKQ